MVFAPRCPPHRTVQYFFYPRSSFDFIQFMLIVGCIFLVAMSVGYKLAILIIFLNLLGRLIVLEFQFQQNFVCKGGSPRGVNPKLYILQCGGFLYWKQFQTISIQQIILTTQDYVQLVIVPMLTFGITRKTLKLFLYGLFVGYPRWQPLVAALFYPDLVGRLPVTWKDYDGNTYLIVLEDVLYFPRCPVRK